jgi:peptide chain release factor 2
VASLKKKSEDLAVLVEWAEAGEAVDAEFGQALDALEQEVQTGEIKKMLGGEHDRKNAIMAIHPGAGGTESQDWAEMLLRMYLRWMERRGFKRDMIDYQPGDEAGLKSATVLVTGEYAYGLLSAEAGVHRLVRISPFDQAARRHTSFASVYVWPELPEDVDIEIDENDLRIDTYRSSGAGGQHVNVTDSAVRLTHIPTGIVVSCQNERSQHRNRDSAMKVLKARLYDLRMKEQQAKLNQISGVKKDIAFGHQIRSYVLAPYRMVKDHRTKEQVGDPDRVLDGDLDPFIKSYLMRKSSGTLGDPVVDDETE